MSGELTIIENRFKPLLPYMGRAIPPNAGLSPDRIMQSVMIACERSPELMECDFPSIQQAVFSACALGLPVDGVTGQGYLIKYRQRAQFVIGFKGYSTIAARSGFTLGGGLVYEGERYEIMLGSGGYARVWPDFSIRKPGAKIVAAFSTMESNSAPPLIDAMSLDELRRIMAMSKDTRPDAPWKVHFDQQCIKTVKRRNAKSGPLEILHLATAFDDAVDQRKSAYIRPEDRTLIVDQEALPLSPMQPPPAEEFTIDQPYRLTGKDAKTGELIERRFSTFDEWAAAVRNLIQRAQTPEQIDTFQTRNREAIAEAARRRERETDDLRLEIMDRYRDLKGIP